MFYAKFVVGEPCLPRDIVSQSFLVPNLHKNFWQSGGSPTGSLLKRTFASKANVPFSKRTFPFQMIINRTVLPIFYNYVQDNSWTAEAHELSPAAELLDLQAWQTQRQVAADRTPPYCHQRTPGVLCSLSWKTSLHDSLSSSGPCRWNGAIPLWSERSLWEVDVPFEKGTFALKRERSLWKRTFALKATLSGFLQTAELLCIIYS